ncbi:MAG TPA: hypothetical protein VGQ57_10630 [Polyangiaceae bacterium]|nr:hypothetical protein [Polyangiaceae bacterium]
MRQRCELCEALGADATRSHKLIGVVVGPRDALLCTDHALFALDSEVASVEELCEVFRFVASVEPAEPTVVTVERGRHGGHAAATLHARH